MNGAQSLIQTLANCGVDVCFGNPGTSEMHFVASLDSTPGMRAVLCLFEGVATGAADGYGRMAGKPAAVLLHLGPGLANGLANLHNARRAATPIVNIVGDHATYHLQYDAPLTSDIVGFARPVSSWICESKSARTVAADAARAVQAACAAPGGIATLILPADTAWTDASHAAAAAAAHRADPGIARPRSTRPRSCSRNGKRSAHPAARRGAARRRPRGGRPHRGTDRRRLLSDTFAPHAELGAGRVPVERLPYFAEQIVDALGARRAVDPGRLEATGVVLRLSRQAQLVLTGRLPFRTARARARGRRAGARSPRRRARRPGARKRHASRCCSPTCRAAR